jgi:hypothetical protein
MLVCLRTAELGIHTQGRRTGGALGWPGQPRWLYRGCVAVPGRAHRNLGGPPTHRWAGGDQRAHPACGRHQRPADVAGQGHLVPGHQPATPRRTARHTRQPARGRGPLAEMVRCYGIRHWIEQSYKQVKDELGWADSKSVPPPRSAATRPWSTARSRSAGTPGSTNRPQATPTPQRHRSRPPTTAERGALKPTSQPNTRADPRPCAPYGPGSHHG